MMQELIDALRQGALHVFRHRKAMLFVSPIRARPFKHDSASVSPSVAAIVAALGENPGIQRNHLLEKLPLAVAGELDEAEKKKLALAADLHWLISEGHVIEFNDGSLDLVRTKTHPPRIPAQVSSAAPNGSAESPASPDDSSEAPSTEKGSAEMERKIADSAPSVVAEESPAEIEEQEPAEAQMAGPVAPTVAEELGTAPENAAAPIDKESEIAVAPDTETLPEA
jgi:hypothetical protein